MPPKSFKVSSEQFERHLLARAKAAGFASIKAHKEYEERQKKNTGNGDDDNYHPSSDSSLGEGPSDQSQRGPNKRGQPAGKSLKTAPKVAAEGSTNDKAKKGGKYNTTTRKPKGEVRNWRCKPGSKQTVAGKPWLVIYIHLSFH